MGPLEPALFDEIRDDLMLDVTADNGDLSLDEIEEELNG